MREWSRGCRSQRSRLTKKHGKNLWGGFKTPPLFSFTSQGLSLTRTHDICHVQFVIAETVTARRNYDRVRWRCPFGIPSCRCAGSSRMPNCTVTFPRPHPTSPTHDTATSPQDSYAATMPGKVKAYELQSKYASFSSSPVGTSSLTDRRCLAVVGSFL